MSGIDGVTRYGGIGPAESGMAPSRREREAIRKVAREFEALMINEMLKSMRATVHRDTLMEGKNGEDIYRSMLDQEYAQSIAAQGGVGLSRLIERELMEQTKPAERGDRDGTD
ncbi:MAG: hypothetical protein Fur0034_17710 [Desulfuromonadia bacterium]